MLRRLHLVHLGLIATVAALGSGVMECGKIPCATDSAVCGSGGRCNENTGECEAIGECDPDVFAPPDGAPPLTMRDGLLTYDARDTAGCIAAGLGDPYAITVEIDGPIDFAFTGDEVFFSIDNGPPEIQCPAFFQSFEVLGADSECDGEAVCFFRCHTCFEETPLTIGAIIVGDNNIDAPLSAPLCADTVSGLIDEDCDAIVDTDERVFGSLPNDDDSDDDGVPDGVEIGAKFCGNPQCENSCTLDADTAAETQILNPDSDEDGRSDGDEDANGNGRVDDGETDPNDPGSL